MSTLARKYRPARLDDLLGQDALVTAMRGAIENDRIASAYLLTGVRGVGKTTTARIIARSVNCDTGPTVAPCGACPSCREIATDSSLDVIELDAASRNGVQDMRDLIETVSYAPMRRGARKIYILDEAHMLSMPAWNALLKTLEETPEHVIFIFATTEPRKIPATIQSRCQKFALHRIEAATIAAHLDSVARCEGTDLEDGVAAIIARAGEGSMRDALSILDQALAGGTGSLTLTSVRELIGRASPGATIDLLQALTAGDGKTAIAEWRAIVDGGIDPLTVLDDIMLLLHQAILAALDPTLLRETGLSPEDIQRLTDIPSKTGQGHLNGALKMLFETRAAVAANPNRQQAAEILILRLASGFSRQR